MEWNEPGVDFRITFKKLGYDKQKIKTDKTSFTTDYDRLQPILPD